MKNKQFSINGGRYKTTRLPGFLLRWKGRLDSRRGEGAVRAHVERMLHRVDVLESQEYLLAEQALKQDRKAAAQALYVLGSMTAAEGGDSKVELQQIRSILNARAQATATVIDANETINNVHSIFAQRCLRIRSYNDTKLQQYFGGVTIGYDRDYTYSDDAKTRYMKHHAACDGAIAKFAAEAYEAQMTETEVK